MKIVVIDYGSGNVASVFNALNQICSLPIVISNQVEEIKSASHIVLPGVGAFNDCIDGLKSNQEFFIELNNQVNNLKKPFLGICVGMQVLASFGFENGKHQGLNWIEGQVEKINNIDKNQDPIRIPHMGWNNIEIEKNNCKLLNLIKINEHFYFANSYHFICSDQNNVIAKVDYQGIKINAILNKENIFAVQFHPEKSSSQGLQLLKNFIDLAIQ